MENESLYEILGVSHDATESEIKKKYRKLARDLHPDRNKDNKEAEERFKKVSAAYAVLGDKEKRKLYDQFGIDGLRDGFDPNKWRQYGSYENRGSEEWPGGAGAGFDGTFDFGGFSGFGALGDIFERLFGMESGRGGRQQRSGVSGWGFNMPGTQVRLKLEVELMDAVLGRELQIVVPVEGEQRRLKVTIPKGIEEGQTLRLKGQGGKSRGRGGTAGDLLLEISIKADSNYQRKGLDLIKRESITVGQAYNGESIEVSTPWDTVKMSIPQGTQGGQRLRLKGKGMRRGKKRGDLYIQVDIRLPKRRDKETKDAVDRLEELY